MDEPAQHLNVTGTMADPREKELVVIAAEHLRESISTFVRLACLARVLEVARKLPEPKPDEREVSRV